MPGLCMICNLRFFCSHFIFCLCDPKCLQRRHSHIFRWHLAFWFLRLSLPAATLALGLFPGFAFSLVWNGTLPPHWSLHRESSAQRGHGQPLCTPVAPAFMYLSSSQPSIPQAGNYCVPYLVHCVSLPLGYELLQRLIHFLRQGMYLFCWSVCHYP